MAGASDKSQTLLMRNLSPMTEEQLREIINEIDDVEGNLIDISFKSVDDSTITLLTFDSIKTAAVVKDALHESPLGPNFTPTEVTFTSLRADVTDFNTKPGCTEQPGLSAVEKRKCESACKQNREIKNNSGKASRDHRRSIDPSGPGPPTSKTRSSPREKSDPIISKVNAESEKSKKHQLVDAPDSKTKVTWEAKPEDFREKKCKSTTKANGSIVLMVKHIDSGVDSDTFKRYLQMKKINMLKYEFNASGVNDNDATVYFACEKDVLAARESLQNHCAIGADGSEAEITVEKVEQPYHLKKQNDPSYSVLESKPTRSQKPRAGNRTKMMSDKFDTQPPQFLPGQPHGRRGDFQHQPSNQKTLSDSNYMIQPLIQPKTHAVLPRNSQPPLNQDYPGGPPLNQNYTGGPPLNRKYSGAPPLNQNYPGGPPLNQNYTGGPPLNRNYSGAPPLNKNYPGGPPLNQNYTGGPPLNRNYSGAPPLNQNYTGGLPLNQNYTGGPPLNRNYSGAPLLNKNYPGGPPLNQNYTGGPPLNRNYSGAPLLNKNYPGGPPLNPNYNGRPLLNQNDTGPPNPNYFRPYEGGPSRKLAGVALNHNMSIQQNDPSQQAYGYQQPQQGGQQNQRYKSADSNQFNTNQKRVNRSKKSIVVSGSQKARKTPEKGSKPVHTPASTRPNQRRGKLPDMDIESASDKVSRMYGNIPDSLETQTVVQRIPDATDDVVSNDDNNSIFSDLSSASHSKSSNRRAKKPKLCSLLHVTGFDSSITKATLETFLHERKVRFVTTNIIRVPDTKESYAVVRFANTRDTTNGKKAIHDTNIYGNILKAVYKDPPHQIHSAGRGTSISDDKSDVGSSVSSGSRFKQNVSTTLKVTGKSKNIDSALVREFLQENNLTFKCLEFQKDVHQITYALLHFDTPRDCGRARSKLHGKRLATGESPVTAVYHTSIVCETPGKIGRSHLGFRHHETKTNKNTVSVKQQWCLKVTAIDESIDEDTFQRFLRRKLIRANRLQWCVPRGSSIGNHADLYFSSLNKVTAAQKCINGCLLGDGDIAVKAEINASSQRSKLRRYKEPKQKDKCTAKEFADDDDAGSDVSSVSQVSTTSYVQNQRELRRRKRLATSLHVTNIDVSINEDDFRGFLLDIVGDFADLQFFHTRSGNFAEVLYDTTEEAEQAKEVLHGKMLGKSKKRIRASLAAGSSDNKQTNNLKTNKGAQGGNKASADKPNERPKNPNQSRPYSVQKGNPNDVIVEDIPRFVVEADLAALISESSCIEGFTNVFISQEVTSNKRSAVFTFQSRAHAVKACIALYGKRIKGSCMDVRLAQEQDGLSNLIAKTKVQALLDDITVEGNKVSSKLKSRMNDLVSEVKEIKEKLEDCSSIQDAISLEQQKVALQQQVGETQSYQDEFDQVSSEVTDKLQQLPPLIFESINLANLDDLRQRFLRECRRIHNPLPIYGHKAFILKTITASDTNACVIRAETGSGKSTQVPQYLIEDHGFLVSKNKDGSKKKVICTQPRRVAAISLARRVAEEYGCTVGEEVGYVAGNSRKMSSRTLLTFMTDRALLNIALTDKNDLNDCACVIIDEAHERSVDTDILLAMLKKIQERRSNFKIVIMSATIDVDLFSKYLYNCPVISIPGRIFPVDTKWCGSVDTINSEDYVFKAVQKVAEIERNEKLPGDILVFLTSQNEIERACNQIASTLKIPGWQDTKNKENVIILPLHGKLQPDDQMNVFKDTPYGKRKIVFATNVAETSITIPGIKYVVDTGVVKECQYDPERNMSLLKVTNISQASAEQRKGRAGRTSPGICYRLYSKTDFEEMEQSKKPEILRVHLGMAMLQLMQMGVKDVQNFDFVESPENGAIEHAMVSLLHLGAVNDCGQLTSVGKKMAKLPLEPRLAKLVLTGIEKNLVIEAVSIAALVSAPGNIVYRGSSEAEKQTSDMMKLTYSSEGGDVLSMLKIYKKWLGVEEKHRSTWCKKNSMNAKTLRSVKENVDEITKILKNALNIGNDKSNISEDETNTDIDTLLRKILTSVYFENLSIYNGHVRAGYTIVAQQKTAVVHPSSVFKSFDSQPQWLIYGDLRRTSQDFICNLTPVDAGWIDEVVPASFRDTFDRDVLERNVTQELKIENVGTALMKILAWKRFEKLRRLEDSITKETDTPCIIEADWQGGSLNVFVASRGEAHAKQKIYETLEDEKTRARQEQTEVSVGSPHSSVRHVVVAGGETGFVLMGDEYRSLDVSNVPSHVNEDEIIKLCGCQHNKVKNIFKFPSHWSQAKRGQWGKVTFLKPSDAEHAKNILEETVYEGEVEHISAEPSLPKQNNIGPRRRPAIETTVEVTWFVGRSRGIAFVTCDTSADSLTLIDNVKGLPLRGKPIRCELKKQNTRVVYISGLDFHVTQDELENGIKKATRVAFNSVSIPRHKPTLNIKNATVRKQLHTVFDNDGIGRLDINILDPLSEKSLRRKGFVNFDPSFQQQMNDKVKDLQTNSVLIANTEDIYHFRMLITSNIYCTEHIYGLLTDQIEELIDKAEGGDKEIVIKSTPPKNRSGRRIHISGNDYQKVLEIRSAMNLLLHGEEVSVEEFVGEGKSEQWVQRSLNNISQGCLQKFLTETSTAFTVIDTRRRVIHLYGNDEDREELKNLLHNYFLSFTKTRVKEVSGVKGKCLRALVLKFGPWLEKLKEEQGAEDISIDTKRGVLMITGSDEVQKVIIDQIQDCLKGSSMVSEGIAEGMDCGICWCPVESDKKTYRLLSCGHYFCLNCLKQLLTHAMDNKTFPIVCPGEKCTESLVLVDIRTIFPEEENQKKLFRSALEAFVTQKSKQCELKFCPSPDCSMIYRQSTDSGTWTCTECGQQICSACGQDPHPGNMSCAEYRISKQSSDAILKWASASGSNVKKCPTPGCSFIEKIESCNKVSCSQCKKHICWHCLESFDTSTECYEHLTAQHGGCF